MADSRFELVQRAQAGDGAAVGTLIERNQAVIFRLVLPLLDDPSEAVEIVKETFHVAFSQLENYGGNVAFSTWLYPIAVALCRKRLRRRRMRALIPARARAFFRLQDAPRTRAEGEQAGAGRPGQLINAVQQLPDDLRLPLILRCDQGLTVHEMAPMLGLNENRVQRRLKAARQQVRTEMGGGSPIIVEDAPGQKLSHQKAREFMENAADHMITDADAEQLRLHLKECEACLQASQDLQDLIDELRSVFQQRWDGQALPATGFSAAVNDLRRVRQVGRRLGNLVGAGLIMILMIGAIAFLPGLTPLEVMSLPATATPTPQPRFRPRPFVRSTAEPLKSNPDLLQRIYPGQLAYITFKSSSNHLFTFQPNGGGVEQLTDGLSVDSYPAWSPDGKLIAYLAIPDAWGLNQVNVIDADGKNMRTVTLPDFPAYSAPSKDWPDSQIIHYPLYGPPHWSPDGKWIASTVWATPDKAYLALLDPEGKAARYLHADGIDRWLISWAPDSRSVAFFDEGGGGLWVWRPDQPETAGENPRRIAGDTLWDIGLGLAWSPNSDRIAAMVGVLKDAMIDVSLMIYNQDDEAYRAMPISVDRAMRFPLRNANLSWSPDGRYLAFMPVFSLLDQTNSEIIIVHVARNRQQRLIEINEPLNGYTWSPDGKWLAYSTSSEIWAASLDVFSSSQNFLVQIAASGGTGLSWQPTTP